MTSTVSLESYTRRVGAIPGTNLGDDICYFARVSNPVSQINNLNNDRLINYLIKHKHWSPFEMVYATLGIDTTRDIARQILRHRSFSFQEFSQRYSVTSTDMQLRDARLQDNKNRQNSIETDDNNLKLLWETRQNQIMHETRLAYDWAIKKGIAKEQARAILPEGLTWTRLYMSGSMRSWIHYIDLRSGPETQKEHRVIAQTAALAIEPIFPQIKEFVK